MGARVLHVLDDGAQVHVASVADAVHLQLVSSLDELADGDGVLIRDLHGLPQVVRQLLLVVGNAHGGAREYIRRPDQHRVPDA